MFSFGAVAILDFSSIPILAYKRAYGAPSYVFASYDQMKPLIPATTNPLDAGKIQSSLFPKGASFKEN